jgi:DNA-directed RNA polymerase subunit M
MQFCPKCGAILMQKKKNFGCPRCSYSCKEKVKITTREILGDKTEIGVVREKEIDTMPVVSEKCPKCKNEEAYFWTLQTRAADESETKFYRCKKCNHTWREYK